MEILMVDIKDIKPYKHNPRINDNAVNYVMKSIKEFGFKVPIVLDKNFEIITGHTRYKASKKLNLDKVPCVIASDLSDEQIKAFRIADNKASELADWDYDLLRNELDKLKDFEFDFNFEELEEIQDINLDDFFEEKPKNNFENEIQESLKTTIKCPKCGEEIEIDCED